MSCHVMNYMQKLFNFFSEGLSPLKFFLEGKLPAVCFNTGITQSVMLMKRNERGRGC